MADSEFEEFRKSLDTFPSHLKTPSPFYTLVPDLTEDDYPSSKSDSSDQEDDPHQTRRQHRSPIIAQTTSYALGGNVNKSGITTALAIGLETPAPTAAAVSKSSDEDDDIGDGLLLRTAAAGGGGGGATGACNGHDDVGQPTMGLESNGGGSSHQTTSTTHMAATGQVERRRRKLPEIPKHRKSFVSQYTGHTSLADELAGGISPNNFPHNHHSNQTGVGGGGGTTAQRSMLAMKCSYLLDEDSSPDSERLTSLGDVDSGHSTAHSPTDFKSMSPTPTSMTPVAAKVASTAAPSSLLPPSTSSSMLSTAHVDDDDDDDDAEDRHGSAAGRGGDDGSAALCSPFQPPAFGGIPFSQIEMLEATHRGLHKFVPRHRDEIEVEIGDSVYVQKEADDLWCEGVNLRTGRQGIFPSAYAVDLDYNDFDPTAPKAKRERYLLGYLGSVETLAHKGTGVVCQAVRKIVGEFGESPAGQLCILEISDQGLRMVDRSNKQMKKEPKKPCIDYFYSLKNVSFCAFHPRDHRYIGFITKHPTIQRFACHVFKGRESTRPVAEAVGRAFQHFYQKFIETAYPIEDIYIE